MLYQGQVNIYFTYMEIHSRSFLAGVRSSESNALTATNVAF